MSQVVFWSGVRLSLLWMAVVIFIISLVAPGGISIQIMALGVLLFVGVVLISYLSKKGILLIYYGAEVGSGLFRSYAWILASVYASLGVLALLLFVWVSSLLDKPAYQPERLSIGLVAAAFLGAFLLMIGTAIIMTRKVERLNHMKAKRPR
jgi:hypothetical protein